MSRRKREQQCRVERDECQRMVSKLMDDAPEWRDWLGWQLGLLDLEYDPHHWITTERVR